MKFELPALPFALEALEPHISRITMSFHHGKHHQAYVNKLNELTSDNKDGKSVEEIIKTAQEGILLNQAGQVWNHTFFWQCLTPNKTAPAGKLEAQLQKDFGGIEKFKEEFNKVAGGHFGSGWAWLLWCPKNQKLVIDQTHDGVSPIRDGRGYPILTCDVWEHAYYLDYQNARPKYLQAWWNVCNWDFATKNFEAALGGAKI